MGKTMTQKIKALKQRFALIENELKIAKQQLEHILPVDAVVMQNGCFNMNDQASVKLTKEGERILIEHYKQYPRLIKIDENNIYKATLWEIMNIYGEHFYNGCTIPFENNSITIAVSA
jgi:hypothetical protein